MRSRSSAAKLSSVTALFGALALATSLAACSSAGTNADPSFDGHGDSVGAPGDDGNGNGATNADDDGNEAGASNNGMVDSTSGGGTTATGGSAADGGAGGVASANDWTNVYAKLFAASTEGHCGNSGCHDVARHGFECGTTADACYQGMIAAGLLDEKDPAASELGDATNSPLSWFGQGGGMPADATKTDATATAMITAWLAAGAPNHGVAVGSSGAADAGASKDGGDEMDASTHADASTDAGTGAKDSGADSGSKDAGKDAGKDSGTGYGSDAGTKDAGPDFSTYTELYDAYFASGTAGHCGNSGCHSATKAGFKCGSTAASCYSGMVAAGLIDTTTPANSEIADPTNSPLSWFNQGGEMPADDKQTLPAGVAAIQAWIAAGASKD